MTTMLAEEGDERVAVDVEVRLSASGPFSESRVRQEVQGIVKNLLYVTDGVLDPVKYEGNKRIEIVAVEGCGGNELSPNQCDFSIHVYTLSSLDVEEDFTEEAEGAESVPATMQLTLPHESLEGMWESLLFDHDIKQRLLKYAASALYFAQRQVDPNLVAFNRVVLLYGVPGTGKSSLCKALAQKLSVRMSFKQTTLVEINAHSLFSKWFSESGKQVMKLFRNIRELVENQDELVCVLIDEVESLTAARQAAMNNAEPSDAVRVVNAVLTQLDSLRHYPNTLIFTTSNITGAIDAAFLDRVDMKYQLFPPGTGARYSILKTSLEALMHSSIIEPCPIPPMHSTDPIASQLASLVVASAEKSARFLRKLPLLTFAFHLGPLPTAPVPLLRYLAAMDSALRTEES